MIFVLLQARSLFIMQTLSWSNCKIMMDCIHVNSFLLHNWFHMTLQFSHPAYQKIYCIRPSDDSWANILIFYVYEYITIFLKKNNNILYMPVCAPAHVCYLSVWIYVHAYPKHVIWCVFTKGLHPCFAVNDHSPLQIDLTVSIMFEF